jgi:hypothetical protein
VHCLYGWSRATLAVENEEIIPTKVSRGADNESPAKQDSNVIVLSPTTRTELHETSILRNSFNDPHIEETIQNQVYSLININKGTVADSCTIYFQTVHRWMPIMSRKRIHDDIVYRKRQLTADLSSLLLSIYLIIQMPPTSGDFTLNQRTLYRNTKSLYEQANVLCLPTLSLIQSGLLIATFEHCHGYVEAACLSIGKCARMAMYMKLDVKVSKLPKKCSNTWELIQEETNLWWGIVIRERYV